MNLSGGRSDETPSDSDDVVLAGYSAGDGRIYKSAFRWRNVYIWGTISRLSSFILF